MGGSKQTSYLSQISQIISVEKNMSLEEFQISVKNLNNLWRFIEINAVFVLNLCGEKSVRRKSGEKKDKYEVCKLTMFKIYTSQAFS